MRFAKSVSLIIATLALAACGSSPSSTSQTPANGDAKTVVVGPATVSGALGQEPKVVVAVSSTPAPALEVADSAVGTGPMVTADSTVTAHYVGYGAQSGAMFDSSWSRGEPATFPLSGVIAGWQQGLVGMQAGGRRVLVIPGDLAYGAAPPDGSGIKANETLIFVVDLVSFQ